MSDRALKIELADFNQIEVFADPNEGVVITGRDFDGAKIELHLTAGALLKLETFLTRANLEQAKRQSSH